MKKEIHQVDGKFYEKCEVVKLPTENHSDLWKSKFNNYLFEPRQTPLDLIHGGYIAHHLYILSNEEIKVGDWVYNSIDKNVVQILQDVRHLCKTDKKIIATTDESLYYNRKQLFDNNLLDKDFQRFYKQLPRPSNEFIKKFCELDGIWEVVVEYENIYDNWKDQFTGIAPIGKNIKVAPDNTITIKPVQEKLYTRDEVVSQLTGIVEAIAKNPKCLISTKLIVQDWIKQNL